MHLVRLSLLCSPSQLRLSRLPPTILSILPSELPPIFFLRLVLEGKFTTGREGAVSSTREQTVSIDVRMLLQEDIAV